MTRIPGLLLVLFSYATIAQTKPPVTVYYENIDGGAAIFVDNEGYCPYTLELTMELENMEADKPVTMFEVIPEQTRKMQIAELKIKDRMYGSSFNFRSTFYWGNAMEKPKTDFVYQLPYQKGESYYMSQGYNGDFSHQGKNSLDFTMPEGTKLCAARDGVVVEIKEDSDRNCANESCKDDANRIIIYHEDGTFAEYAHLQKRGSLVNPGDRIRKGQVIGRSGNTGFTSGPHLHFEVFYFEKAERITIETKFEIAPGRIEFLEEKVKYTAF